MKHYSPTLPMQIEDIGNIRHFRFDISPITREEAEEYGGDAEGYVFEEATVRGARFGLWDYPTLVTAIIRAHYSADEVEAIVANYLSSGNYEHIEEMNALQLWRKHAKELAHEVFGSVDTQNSNH